MITTALDDSLSAARAARKQLAEQAQQYRNIMHFVHVGDYTLAWRRMQGTVIHVASTVRSPADSPDPLVGINTAGDRMLHGEYVTIKLPNHKRNPARYLRKIFSAG